MSSKLSSTDTALATGNQIAYQGLVLTLMSFAFRTSYSHKKHLLHTCCMSLSQQDTSLTCTARFHKHLQRFFFKKGQKKPHKQSALISPVMYGPGGQKFPEE